VPPPAKKRPVKSKKKLGSLVSVDFGLWERFLIAITRSIVAENGAGSRRINYNKTIKEPLAASRGESS